MTKKEIARYIDHTILAADAGEKEVLKICDEALKYEFASVCINPAYVPLAAQKLKASPVKVCTVIGFPLGATSSASKAFEAADAIKNGADEVDMVINIGYAKAGNYDGVEKDIAEVVKASRAAGKELNKEIIVKVILETCLISDEAVVQCSLASKKAGADFVKTSTGFATPKDASGNSLPNGATAHHVELMRKTVGSEMGVKASGGIRTPEAALEMIKSGANRIGSSSGIKIVENWDEEW